MNLKQGNLENLILNALWNIEESGLGSIDVSDIKDKINMYNQKWAYTTVKTVLDRLVDKNIIDRAKHGKKYFYQSKISREVAGNNAIRKLAKQYFNDDIDSMYIAVKQVHSEALTFVGNI